MPGQITASPQEWRSARIALLEKEKQHTRDADALAAQRADMPLLRIPADKYTFTRSDPVGASATLNDLFAGKDQLVVYHFMFAPEWEGPCKSCSFFADSMPQHLRLLKARNTQLVLVSRAPAEKLGEWSIKMGWSHIPWFSSEGSTFNYDFHVTQDESVAPVEYNYLSKAELEAKGLGGFAEKGERPGISVFVKGKGDHEGEIFHSYSAYGRGLDRFLTTYSLLELTPAGRQEPEGKKVAPGGGKYHFEKHE